MLDCYISRALNIELEGNCLNVIDDSSYVLTLDYTIKMLNIHERRMCGMPVIIEGETGVGKTALIEMLSKLWNLSLLNEWNRHKVWILNFFETRIKQKAQDTISDDYQVCLLSPLYVRTMPTG